MADKVRTWPYCVCEHGTGWNVRHPDGTLLRGDRPYPLKRQAEALRDLLNEAFDLGREDAK